MTSRREERELANLSAARWFHSLDISYRTALLAQNGKLKPKEKQVLEEDIRLRQWQVRRAIAIIRYERRKHGASNSG